MSVSVADLFVSSGRTSGRSAVAGRRLALSPMSIRVVLTLALVGAAYHHSLRALLRFLSADTPLAYLGLLPVLVVVLALVKARPRPDEGQLPDRQVDWIIGLPLLAVAAFIALVLPDRLSYEFWTNRIDVLGLPFFAAGVTSLVFGSRVLWRIRLPIAALALAWPLPYELVLDRVLDQATRITLFGVRSGVGFVAGATQVGDSLFALGEGVGRFQVNVAPQCAGANSVLGFLLVGGAIVASIGGSRRRKAAWLAAGTALLVVVNVLRILAVFWVGARWGERAAIEWLHPYAGLVLFTATIAVLVAWLPRFGLRLSLPPRGRPAGARLTSRPGRRMRRRVSVTLGVLLGAASTLGFANAALARFDPFLGVASAATATPLTGSSIDVPGWSARHSDTYSWATRYFGASSTWHRFTMAPLQGAGGLVWLDVVQTDDLRRFSDYGIEACYRFHDYEVLDSRRVEIGTPAPAQLLAYRDQAADRSFRVVSWVRPVAGGRFERAVLIAETGPGVEAAGDLLDLARQVATTA